MQFATLDFVLVQAWLLIFLQQAHYHILSIHEEAPQILFDYKEIHEIDIEEFLLGNIWCMEYCQEYGILHQDRMHQHHDHGCTNALVKFS